MTDARIASFRLFQKQVCVCTCVSVHASERDKKCIVKFVCFLHYLNI